MPAVGSTRAAKRVRRMEKRSAAAAPPGASHSLRDLTSPVKVMGIESVGAVGVVAAGGVAAGVAGAPCCVASGTGALWAVSGTPLPSTSRAAAAVVNVVRMGGMLGVQVGAQ